MKKVLLFTCLAFMTVRSYGQAGQDFKDNSDLCTSTNWHWVHRPQEYLTTTNNEFNSFSSAFGRTTITLNIPENQSQKNYQGKRRLFVGLTVPLVIASLIANQKNNKDLAGGFAIGGIVTSSLGLYFTIKEDKQKKTN